MIHPLVIPAREEVPPNSYWLGQGAIFCCSHNSRSDAVSDSALPVESWVLHCIVTVCLGASVGRVQRSLTGCIGILL